jgi:hypothetical protein
MELDVAQLIWWWQRLLCSWVGHSPISITPYTQRCQRCRHYIKTRKPRKRKGRKITV